MLSSVKMYAKYQQYIKKEKHITIAKKVMDYYNYYGRNYTIEKILLDMFVDKYTDNDSWEPSKCILTDFPYEMQYTMIYDYIFRDRGEPSVDPYDVCKLIYNLWQHKESNEKLNECCDFIIEGLTNFELYNEGDLRRIAYDEYKSVSSAYYYAYYILGFIPLLENKGIDIMDIVYKMHYDDGQDFLMFGLYQYEPSEFYNKLKEILIYWEKTGNIRFAQGTGILSQVWKIICKYKKAGYNLLEDPDLPFLKKIYKDEDEDKNISDYKRESKYSWIDYELNSENKLDPDKFV